MVTVIGYSKKLTKEGKPYILLDLRADISIAQTRESGKYYLLANKASIPCIFDEETAKSFIGKTIPGRIDKVFCQPYEFKYEETKELLLLSHRYEFFPSE